MHSSHEVGDCGGIASVIISNVCCDRMIVKSTTICDLSSTWTRIKHCTIICIQQKTKSNYILPQRTFFLKNSLNLMDCWHTQIILNVWG